MKNVTRAELEKVIDDIDNTDENMPLLEKAMNYYCGTYDRCEGFKHALKITLEDQYNNHPEDQEPDSLNSIMDILNKKEPTNEEVKKRLEYLRKQIEGECISQGEIAELVSLKEHIEEGDNLLLEWAGVPEFEEEEPIGECYACDSTLEDKYCRNTACEEFTPNNQ